jgi:deoxyribodipyrimidine photolyase-like uncharacterized protein
MFLVKYRLGEEWVKQLFAYQSSRRFLEAMHEHGYEVQYARREDNTFVIRGGKIL